MVNFEERIKKAKTVEEFDALLNDIYGEEKRLEKLRREAWVLRRKMARRERAQMLKGWIGENVCYNMRGISLTSQRLPPRGKPAKLVSVGSKYAHLDYGKEVAGGRYWQFPILDVMPYEKGMENDPQAEKDAKMGRALGRVLNEVAEKEKAAK